MKIKAINSNTKKPLLNKTFQLQIKGKDSGYQTVTTDSSGIFLLEDKYKGQQISYYLQGSTSTQTITASDGATLYVPVEEKQKTPADK